jgi:hypothetical protein
MVCQGPTPAAVAAEYRSYQGGGERGENILPEGATSSDNPCRGSSLQSVLAHQFHSALQQAGDQVEAAMVQRESNGRPPQRSSWRRRRCRDLEFGWIQTETGTWTEWISRHRSLSFSSPERTHSQPPDLFFAAALSNYAVLVHTIH